MSLSEQQLVDDVRFQWRIMDSTALPDLKHFLSSREQQFLDSVVDDSGYGNLLASGEARGGLFRSSLMLTQVIASARLPTTPSA